MEIRDTRTPPQPVAFSTLKPGDVFMSGDNLYMVVTSKADVGANTIVLSDGRLYLFGAEDEVAPCKAYVVKET